jgi:hypothetical protein
MTTTNTTDAYWIDGSAYCRGCVECRTPAIDAADATRGPAGDARCPCCGGRADAGEPEYRIAFVRESGNWDIVETFHAADHDAANAYAEERYADHDWYVIDHTGRNINGGVDG